MIVSFSFSQTQTEMNEDAENKFNKTEKELNTIYNKVLLEYKADTIFIKHLKKSQMLWKELRDAEAELKYPDTLNGRYSTPYITCRFSYEEKITQERISVLKEWIDGVKEWKECDGPLKVKQ